MNRPHLTAADHGIHNPFRIPEMRASFDECVAAHLRHSPALQRGAGNSIATAFWRGYDSAPLIWDRASRNTMEYAQYRAGAACAKYKQEQLA